MAMGARSRQVPLWGLSRDIGSAGRGPGDRVRGLAVRGAFVPLVIIALAVLCLCLSAQRAWGSDYASYVRYDADGRVAGEIGPDPDGAGPLPRSAVRTQYDALGRPETVEAGHLDFVPGEGVDPQTWPGFEAHQRSVTAYDGWGRPVSVRVYAVSGGTATLQTLTETRYDGFGRPECVALRMGLQGGEACAPVTTGTTAPGVTATSGADRVTRTH